MSLGSPLGLTRLLFWHALYRLKLELRVHRQVEDCPLRSSFQKWLWRCTNRGIINQKETFKWTNNIATIQIVLCFEMHSPESKSEEWSVLLLDHAQNLWDAFPSGHEGKAVSSIDTESHCEVRTTSDMKLSTACQQDFTLCPSDASLFYPWKKRLFHCTISVCHATWKYFYYCVFICESSNKETTADGKRIRQQ